MFCAFTDDEFLGGALGFVENVAVVAEAEPSASDDEHGSYNHYSCSVFIFGGVRVWADEHEGKDDEDCWDDESECNGCAECGVLTVGVVLCCVAFEKNVFLFFAEFVEVFTVCFDCPEGCDDCGDKVERGDKDDC